MRIEFCYRNCNIVFSCPITQGGSRYWPRDSSVRDPLGRLVLKKCSRAVWVQARRGAALRELESTLNETETQASIPVVKELHWHSPLQIIRYPDPRLRAANARIGVFDESLEKLGRELLDTMYEADDGVGLAAPQVGLNLRLMVFNPTGVRGEPDYILVNPRVIKSSNTADVSEEGCLSFPNIYGDVQRPTKVSIRAQNVKGGKLSLVLDGWQARLFQHEYDHLEGVLFHDRMDSGTKASIKAKLQALEAEFARANPEITTEHVL